jgi:hypothetical protein
MQTGGTVALRDPGPAMRFSAVVADEATPGVIVQRLADGESLKQIAVAWGIPYLRFLSWIAANGDLTEQCTRVRELAGIELRMEGMELLDDEATPENVTVVKERALYRERLSRDLNRPLFGKFTKHEHEVTFDLGEKLRRARERVIEQAPEPLEVVPAVEDGLI